MVHQLDALHALPHSCSEQDQLGIRPSSSGRLKADHDTACARAGLQLYTAVQKEASAWQSSAQVMSHEDVVVKLDNLNPKSNSTHILPANSDQRQGPGQAARGHQSLPPE